MKNAKIEKVFGLSADPVGTMEELRKIREENRKRYEVWKKLDKIQRENMVFKPWFPKVPAVTEKCYASQFEFYVIEH